ncbi:MAG: hypothetical protein KAQ65_05155 [Candidatus Thorarchaeota archaeon]|nr:hypothetical protein [Candidatus Thorarchaeota archaeon]
MPERVAREGRPTQVELDVVRTFGWGIIALEETMYQRYIQLSARSSLITQNDFRSLLLQMETKGYLSSTNLHGKRAYRRLLVNGEKGVSVHPKNPLDEMRLVVGSLKAREKERKEKKTRPRKRAYKKERKEKKTRPRRITSEVASESQSISEELVVELENCCEMESSGIRRKAAVHQHIEKMLEALAESETNLFEYVRSEIPECLECVGKVLRSRGSDFLMLTLRLAEPQVRRYIL